MPVNTAGGGLSLRRAVGIVAALNFGTFGFEAAIALAIGSVSLVADSVDFLEDAALNLLIFLALGAAPRVRARVGMLLAAILLVPTLATLAMAWHKLAAPTPPAVGPLALTALGALVVNLGCAALLLRFREHRGSLTRAAFLSARNDAIANVAIIAAAAVTALTRSGWPDIAVGLAVGALNAGAAREVWRAARAEHRAAAATDPLP